MKLVFWWNIPCKAIFGVIKELSLIDGVEVVFITGRLSYSRKTMGWEEVELLDLKHVFIEDYEWKSKAFKLLDSHSNYFHIFNGYYYPKRINNIIKEAINRNLNFGIFSEAPSNPYKSFKYLISWTYQKIILPIKTYRIIRKSKFIFCLSGSSKTEIDKLYWLGWKKNQIINFGYFSEMKDKKISKKANLKPNIFCNGNLVFHKGVDILIKALYEISLLTKNFHCHITGDGNEKNKLIRLTKKYGLKNYITFYGVLNQKKFEELQDKMDILVAPGRIEPWGIRINEAIQKGMAVVISHKVGAKELIETSKGGCVFKSGDYLDLSKKLYLLLSDTNFLKDAKLKNIIYEKKINPKVVSKYIYDIINKEEKVSPPWLS